MAAFSLALAICDALKPKVIWNELQFDPVLGTNLLEGDFFSLFDEGEPFPLLHPRRWPSAEGWPGYFDVVVGNPPFESSLTDCGRRIDAFLAKSRGTLPDRQAAYLFLEQAAKLLKPARLCLLQPSGFLYNRKTAQFRKHFFRQVHCDEILDFTSIRNLFDGADPKTITIHARGKLEGRRGWMYHLTFRRTFSATQRIGFELDHYDRHRVPQEAAEGNPFIWRANLLGGGRLAEMSARLASMRTLFKFVESKGWVSGEGFIVGTSGEPADYLHGLPFLPTTAPDFRGHINLCDHHCRGNRILPAWPRGSLSASVDAHQRERHTPCCVLDERTTCVSRQDCRNPRAAQRRSRSAARLRHVCRTPSLVSVLLPSQWVTALVGKATAILRGDIADLPYPEDKRELDLSFWEKILVEDALDYMAPFVRLGQNSEVLERQARTDQVRAYAEVFCRMLGSVYRNLKFSDSINANGLILQPFYFGDRSRIEWSLNGRRKQLDQLIYKQQHESLRTMRVVRLYNENVMLIVKPDRLRYWIRSTAIRDADETLLDLRRQGY